MTVMDQDVEQHRHQEPVPDPKVGHERQVIQRAAADALRAVETAHNTFRIYEARMQRERELMEAALREVEDKVLLFSQFHLSFDEVVNRYPCCPPPPDRIKFWTKLQQGLTYG